MAAPSVNNICFHMVSLLLIASVSESIDLDLDMCRNDIQNDFLKCVQYSPASQLVDYDIKKVEGAKKMVVFCYPGQEKYFYRMWTNAKITIHHLKPDKEYDVYMGKNFSDVVSAYKGSGSFLSWSLPINLFQRHEHSFSPFNSSCIGIATYENYTVNFLVKSLEPWYILYTVLGLLVFFSAPFSSRNIYLHYGTGVSLGILSSLLIIVFILSKFLPQKLKMVGYAVGVLSTSLSMFLLHLMAVHINDVMINNWQVLLGYICVSGLISFFFVYRYGPVSNPRTLDLIRWSLQLVGLTFVYHGTQIAETSIAIILLALCLYNFPFSFFSWLNKLRHRYFPEKHRFLTAVEYYEEKERATEKGLEELREFCRSPDCNSWRTISRITSPNRFASFVEGGNHISDNELSLYNSDCAVNPPYYAKDESSDSEDLSYVMEVIAKRHPE